MILFFSGVISLEMNCKPVVLLSSFLLFFQEDTISINHNWINGCGIERTWGHLQREFSKVQYFVPTLNVVAV